MVGWNPASIGPDDGHAMAHLVARRRGQILRRLRRVHDRRRASAPLERVRHWPGPERTDHRCDPVRHPRRRSRPRGLSDRFGRKIMFFVEMVIFVAFLVALVFAPNFPLVVICLFGIGLALGCDYPTAHIIISENIPSSARGKLVLGAFAFQAIGAL